MIHKALKGVQTKEDAEKAERKLIQDAVDRRYGFASSVSFVEFGNGTYTRYFESVNTNLGAKRLYVRKLCEAFKGKTLDAITPQDLRDVQTKLRKKYSASSVNLIMSTASKIFTLACQEGILDKNPMQYVTRLKEPPPRDRLLTEDEKERLWKELEKDELMFRLVTLAVNLPLRRGQFLAIVPDAVNLSAGVLATTPSKGRAARLVPLNSSASSALAMMIADNQIPFPLKETGIRKRFKKAVRNAEIEDFRFHDLRKMLGSGLQKRGVHSKTIQDLFGHSSMRITDVYLPPEFEAMREAVNSLDVKEVEGVQ